MTLRKGTVTMNGVERVIETVLAKGGNRTSVRTPIRCYREIAISHPLAHLAVEVRERPIQAHILGL